MKGVVACPQPRAADVGADILAKGGTAFDAAVAAAFAQMINDPFMCGVGGMGTLHYYRADTGESGMVDFYNRAGANVRPDMWEKDFKGRTPISGYTLFDDPVQISTGGALQTGYTINGNGIDDYAAYGGGGHLALGKDFQVCEITLGVAYLYTKYDIDLEDDHSHLFTYGIIAGVPVGRKLAANIYFTETRNVTDYERELIDDRFFTLGTEWILAVSGSWVFSCGYRTIIGYENYSSHEGYLGTLMTF